MALSSLRPMLSEAPVVVVLLAALGCSKSAPAPERTAPWLAQPSASGLGVMPFRRWQVESRGEAQWVLEGTRRVIRGRLRLVRGTLELDVVDLLRLRGTLAVDLGTLAIEDGDGGVERTESARAQNWLDIGASRPSAERERWRWAEYRITRVVEVSAKAAHEGRRVDPAIAGAQGASGEVRRVELTAEGTLEIHGYRVERRAHLELDFEYASPASLGQSPVRVQISSRRPFPVILAEHDIVPRDTLGTLVSAELPLLGRDVGKEARVQVQLAARPWTATAENATPASSETVGGPGGAASDSP